jgi:hypothetical protein
MKRSWYALYEADDSEKGVREIQPDEAQSLNEVGYGIFWSVNEFDGPRRKENLVKINSWAVDLDSGSKPEQWARIKAGLIPSLVVETRRGFHVYFHAKDGRPENWNAIVSDRLVPFYQADKNAKDIARILRVPGFYHCKNLLDRFQIRVVHEANVTYSEEALAHYYPPAMQSDHLVAGKRPVTRAITDIDGDDFWERAFWLDCRDALERLSGTDYVGGEVFTFKPAPRGHWNIYVNGKGTSCFLDANNRIGSLAGGGPSVIQWLKYYGHTYKSIYAIVNSLFPDIRKNSA